MCRRAAACYESRMDWFSRWFWIWPTLLGCIGFGHGVMAVIRRRVFFFRNPDPDAAIYREYEPTFYWVLVAVHLVMAGLFFWAAARLPTT